MVGALASWWLKKGPSKTEITYPCLEASPGSMHLSRTSASLFCSKTLGYKKTKDTFLWDIW